MNGHYYSVTAEVTLRVFARSEDEATEIAEKRLGEIKGADDYNTKYLRLDDEEPPEEEHWI